MRCIFSKTGDPFFNLAAEEYLLKNYTEEFYFQYVNDPAVVVGKHQNALAEIDVDYLQEHGIVLARRISGGGAVYHDRGNMNYSFITNESPGDFVKFRKYTLPVISALQELGVEAFPGKRNEVLTGGGKISGTASHVFKTRVLHHGTLLFDADLERLGRCLYVDMEHYSDRAVKSIRSEVVNIRELLSSDMDSASFYDFIFRYIVVSAERNVVGRFSEQELEEIGRLRDEKFLGWEWNYGYSPKYTVERKLKGLRITTTVEKGIIVQIAFDGSGIMAVDPAVLSGILTGTRHDRFEARQKLRDHFDDELTGAVLEALF